MKGNISLDAYDLRQCEKGKEKFLSGMNLGDDLHQEMYVIMGKHCVWKVALNKKGNPSKSSSLRSGI